MELYRLQMHCCAHYDSCSIILFSQKFSSSKFWGFQAQLFALDNKLSGISLKSDFAK